MPWLTRFSAGATVFERAIAPSSWTLPTLVSLATGRTVPAHTVDRVERELPPSLPTLAEELSAAGYQTAFFGVNPVLLVERGPTRGFSQVWTDRGAAAGMLNQALAGWLRTGRDPARPLFLHLHYYEPHCPYRAPAWATAALAEDPVPDAGVLSAGLRAEAGCSALRDDKGVVIGDIAAYHAAYDAELRAVDRALESAARLLGEHGVGGLWAVTSDHGESFGEHGVLGHSTTLWEPELHVPLVVRYPVQDRGLRVRPRVGLVGLHGTLRAAALGGEDPLASVSTDQDVLTTTRGGGAEWAALYQGRHKAVAVAGEPTLVIDLDADPDEHGPTLATRTAPDVAGAVRTAQEGAPAAVELRPDAEELELLRQLGYTL
jgi:arylsulfatase A-like enzyme